MSGDASSTLSRRVRRAAWLGLSVGAVWLAVGGVKEPAPVLAAAPVVAPLHPPARGLAGVWGTLAEHTTQRNSWTIPAAALDPRQAIALGDGLGQVLPDGTEVRFTLDPKLQEVAQAALTRFRVEWGAVVAVNPKTGAILAMGEHAEGHPERSRLALQAGLPAASLFKLVTSAALLEYAQLKPDEEICTHGGHHGLTLYNLKPNARLDKQCETFAQALGSSNNVAFARWADARLEPAQLQEMARRFLFGQRLPFPWAVGVSEARVPTGSRLGFARTAAGFEATTLSPLHAALIGAAIANDGKMMAPILVEQATQEGAVVFQAEPALLQEVLSEDDARTLRGLMQATVNYGTGRKFFEIKGKSRINVNVAGKSGSLSGKTAGGTRHYSWFVAMAPAEDPQIVVAAVVVNGAQWTTKGVIPVRDVLEAYFSNRAGAPSHDSVGTDPLAIH